MRRRRKKIDLPNMVARGRFFYHSHMIDLVNVGNQLGLIKDDRAEELNRKHTMIIFNDLFPRLFPGVDFDEFVKANCN